MSFLILSQAGADEPFAALVSGIKWRMPVVLDEFLMALARLVDEGLLSWRIEPNDRLWSPNPEKRGFYGELLGYVEWRIRNGENLDCDRDEEPDYHFSITPQGAERVEELHTQADAAGRAILDAIRDFKEQRGRLPSKLADLYEQWPHAAEPPMEGCGGWWYRLAKGSQSFRFGYFTIGGHHFYYDKIRDAFEPSVPPMAS